MSDETSAPSGKQQRDWVNLYRVIVFIFSLFSVGGFMIMFYSLGSYIRAEASSQTQLDIKPMQDEVYKITAPLVSLPSRVERLEDFRIDQRRLQEQTTNVINLIQQDLAAIKASQDESKRNVERILSKLDR